MLLASSGLMASVGGTLLSAPTTTATTAGGRRRVGGGGGGGGVWVSPLSIECSSRPRKKATAHHIKTRPRKTQPWDIKRKGPTRYPPLPPLPPDWSFLPDQQQEDDTLQQQQQQVETTPTPASN